jgi:hypothetical protein
MDGRGRPGVFGRLTHQRYVSIVGADLSACLYEALEGRAETIFGDSIRALQSKEECPRILDGEGERILIGSARSACPAGRPIGWRSRATPASAYRCWGAGQGSALAMTAASGLGRD